MSNPYAPPSVNEPKTGNTFLWRIAGFAFITLGLMILLIIGGTLLFETVRLTSLARQAEQEAMYQRDLAQKALEQAELQQKKNSEGPARN